MNSEKKELSRLILEACPILMHKLLHSYHPPKTEVRLIRSQWKALLMLRFADKPNMSQLSNFVNMEKGSVTTVVDSLITLGLVERIPDEQDRRKIRLALTESGRSTVKACRESFQQHIEKKLKVLNEAEINLLFQSLETVQSLAQKI